MAVAIQSKEKSEAITGVRPNFYGDERRSDPKVVQKLSVLALSVVDTHRLGGFCSHGHHEC